MVWAHSFPLSLNTLIKMKAVIYARVSSIGDRQNTDRQISDLLDYVEYQSLELCKIFEGVTCISAWINRKS